MATKFFPLHIDPYLVRCHTRVGRWAHGVEITVVRDLDEVPLYCVQYVNEIETHQYQQSQQDTMHGFLTATLTPL